MSTSAGRQAEQIAADFLRKKGFKILAQNWRTRWCEIDIVAEHKEAVYFVEVKYRATSAWGGGLDYITQTKIRQVQFAAEFWIASNAAKEDYRIACIELTDTPPKVKTWLTDIS